MKKLYTPDHKLHEQNYLDQAKQKVKIYQPFMVLYLSTDMD